MEAVVREERLIKLPEVLSILGIGKSAFYKGIAEGKYPEPVQMGARAVRWPQSEIFALAHALCAQRGRRPGAVPE